MTNLQKNIIIIALVLLIGGSLGAWITYSIMKPKSDSSANYNAQVIAENEVAKLRLQITDDSLDKIDSMKKIQALENRNTELASHYDNLFNALKNAPVQVQYEAAKVILKNDLTKDTTGNKISDNGLYLIDSLSLANAECGELLDKCGQVVKTYQGVVARDSIELLHSKAISANLGIDILSLKSQSASNNSKVTLLKIERALLAGTVLITGTMAYIFSHK